MEAENHMDYCYVLTTQKQRETQNVDNILLHISNNLDCVWVISVLVANLTAFNKLGKVHQ